MNKLYPLISVILGFLSQATAMELKVCPSFDYYFYDQWNHVAKDHWPSLSGIDSAYLEERISIYPILSNFAISSNKNANVTLNLKILNPLGKTILNKKGVQIIEGKQNVSNAILLANTSLGMKLSKNNIPGKYKIISLVRDKIGKVTLQDTTFINFIDFVPNYQFINDSAFFCWVENYYLKPDPKSTIAAIDYYLKNDILHNDSLFATVFYFFDLIITDNPFVGDQIILIAQKQGEGYQSYIAMLLRILQWDRYKLKMALPLADDNIINKEWQNIDPIQHAVYKLDQNPIIFTFYYSGSYKAIKMLAESMWSRDIDSIPDSKRCKECETIESINAFKNKLYYKMSKNALENLFESHALVREYLKYMYLYDAILPVVKEELGKLITLKIYK